MPLRDRYASRAVRQSVLVVLAVLTLAGAVRAAAFDAGATGSKVKRGGTFRISFGKSGFDTIDPAVAYLGGSWQLLEPICARLMTRPDQPLPEGLRLVPELAAAYPHVSRNRRTYIFQIRRGLRFSTGAPVTARSFARAINRALDPALESPGAPFVSDILGAEDVLGGKTRAAAGVVASGNRLSITLMRPAPDFVARMSMPFFCAVPPDLPADPEGVKAPLASPAPYYLAEYIPGRRIVFQRNRFYRGRRPHHVDRFEVDLQAAGPEEVVDAVESGQADWGYPGPTLAPERWRELARRYGVNRSRFFVKPSLVLEGFALNTSRPLFRNNARLRRAVNFAVDRRALLRERGGSLIGRLTDQYLPPAMPGFVNARLYPLDRPNLRKARALARGRTRSGKGVIYASDGPIFIAQAQILKQNLAEIGLDLAIQVWPARLYQAKIGTRGEPFDIARIGWAPDYVDPYAYINVLFDGRRIRNENNSNASYFNSRTHNSLMDRAARLSGSSRYRAYGALDVRLARDAAPLVAYTFENARTLVSKRVGCKILRPELDLVAVCLR